jgi:GNAT superfamily N-acetyltransferase
LALSKPCRRIPPRSVASERWAGTFCYTLGYYRDMESSSLFGRPVICVSRVGSSRAQLVFDLTLKAFEEYRDVLDLPTGVLFETVADVHKSIDSEAAAIAWIGDRAVGAVRWEARPGYLNAGRLAVLPEARGAGVGAALMAFVEDRARMLGLSEVQVGVRSALPGNIDFSTGSAILRYGLIHIHATRWRRPSRSPKRSSTGARPIPTRVNNDFTFH